MNRPTFAERKKENCVEKSNSRNGVAVRASGVCRASGAGTGCDRDRGHVDPPRPPPIRRRSRPSWGVPEGRMFFPHNWVRGYVNFDVAPPHNEPDLGRCSQSHAVIVARRRSELRLQCLRALPVGRLPRNAALRENLRAPRLRVLHADLFLRQQRAAIQIHRVDGRDRVRARRGVRHRVAQKF